MSRPLYKRIYHATIKPVLNFVTLSNVRHKMRAKRRQEQIDTGIPPKTSTIVEGLEKEINNKNVVYIFQHQMFDPAGTKCFNGGAERYVVDLAEVLHKKGYTPILIQMGSKKVGLWKKIVKKLIIYGLPIEFEDYEITCRCFKNYKFVIYSGATPVWGEKIHPNIMISHGITWDSPITDAQTGSLLSMIQDVDNFVSVDTNTISWFKSTFPVTLKNFNAYYIPNYVDTSLYKPSTKRKDDKIHVTFPRRAAPERGYWLMSAALKPILDKYENVVFNFVGFAHGEDIQNDIRYWEKMYPGRVSHCCVSPDEMPKIYQNTDISLVPTIYCEGTSLSCLEAQACGNVVISTIVGGLPNLILDGHNGLLISPTEQSLLSALDRVLSDKKLRSTLSKNAVSVAQAFDKSVWMEKWAKVIYDVTRIDKYCTTSQDFLDYFKNHVLSDEKTIIINASTFDYYSVLQQRPNHVFNLLAEKGYTCIFSTFEEKVTHPSENIYVIPWHYLKDVLCAKIADVLIVPMNYPIEYLDDVKQYIDENTVVLYELLDDFTIINNQQLREKQENMFKNLITRSKTFVFTSADSLYELAIDFGTHKNKITISKNAVNIDDFTKNDLPVPNIMKKILKKKKPIIGYYGALTAHWFNFDLLLELIKKNQDKEFVLMGLQCVDSHKDETDDYFKKLSKFDNFTYIPPVPYKEIPSYAKCWDVATIPFKINDITLGCSPVKLFEYMAMGLPIVTTPMPECKLYKSVFIAKDASEFEKQIAAALKAKKTKKYQETLAREASENTWEARVNDMIKIIEKHYKK